MTGDYNPNWGNYNPYGPAVPQPCPTCNRCPTCGSYRPAITWTSNGFLFSDRTTWTSDNTLSGCTTANPVVIDTCPSDSDTDCSHD